MPVAGVTGGSTALGRPVMRAAAWLVLAVACGTAPPARPPATARRVVSLAPSVTEVIYGLGAGDRLVGVCGQCDYPEAATRLPRVGGYLAPSVEAVLGARPDLVVAVPSPGNREAVRAIERAGVRVLVVKDRTLKDLWPQIRALAAALDVADAGEELVATVTAGLESVRRRTADLPRQRALLVVGHSPLVVAGRGTLQDELLTLVGGVNVAADAGGAWPQVSLELVVDRAPEVILDAAMGTEAGGRELFAALTTVPAVRGGRIVPVRDDALFRAGPRVVGAASILAAAVHLDAFSH